MQTLHNNNYYSIKIIVAPTLIKFTNLRNKIKLNVHTSTHSQVSTATAACSSWARITSEDCLHLQLHSWEVRSNRSLKLRWRVGNKVRVTATTVRSCTNWWLWRMWWTCAKCNTWCSCNCSSSTRRSWATILSIWVHIASIAGTCLQTLNKRRTMKRPKQFNKKKSW